MIPFDDKFNTRLTKYGQEFDLHKSSADLGSWLKLISEALELMGRHASATKSSVDATENDNPKQPRPTVFSLKRNPSKPAVTERYVGTPDWKKKRSHRIEVATW